MITRESLAELVVGQLYRVSFDDCCATGWFIGRFVESVRDSDGDVDTVRFDAGEIGPEWSTSWQIEPFTPTPDRPELTGSWYGMCPACTSFLVGSVTFEHRRVTAQCGACGWRRET